MSVDDGPVDATARSADTRTETDTDADPEPETAESIRDVVDRSRRGAPAAGEAVRDRFSADEIFQRVIATAEEEVTRSTTLLFFSGVAAGMWLSFSFVGYAALHTKLPPGLEQVLAPLAYPVGFLFVILGRSQLYTENTLTPVTLVLARVASLPILLRVWGIVLVANLVGVAITTGLFVFTPILTPAIADAAAATAADAVAPAWRTLFYRGIPAGALVAGLVWLVHAARDTVSRLALTFVVVYFVPVLDLAHCIVGAHEAFYLVYTGAIGPLAALGGYFLPVLLGNTVGGVGLVALVHYAQISEEHYARDGAEERLDLDEVLFGEYAGRTRVASPAQLDPDEVEHGDD